LPGDHYALPGFVSSLLEALLQPLRLALRTVDVRGDAGASRREAVALEVTGHEPEAAIRSQQSRNQQDGHAVAHIRAGLVEHSRRLKRLELAEHPRLAPKTRRGVNDVHKSKRKGRSDGYVKSSTPRQQKRTTKREPEWGSGSSR